MSNPIEIQLPRARDCAHIARREIEGRLAGELDFVTLEDLKTVATELVENAYLHGDGQIVLRLSEGDGQVQVEVIDEGEGAAIVISETWPEGGGWGLKIVDQLALSWGAHEGTTHVWAVVPARADG